MLSDEFLQELRSKIDIEQIVAPYVNLRRRGRTLTGLCPFHNEKTPSFTLYPENQSFYCFGCGAGGDAITFVRRMDNLDYMEAVKSLADRAGLALPQDGYDDTLMKQRRRMLEANREAARYFHETLFTPAGEAALTYLQGRGLSMKMIRHFGLGCAPDRWDGLLQHMRQKGYSEAELGSANLARRSDKTNRTSYYDNFRNRMIVPIIDLRGNVIAFGGRVLDDSKPKYVNTSDTLVYKKSQAIFALNFAKSANNGRLILAEGYMDVIACHQAGFTNAVACLGTALTREQARLLSRYADEIVLSYDADGAGQEATRRAIGIFNEIGMKLRVLRLTGGKDPDEILRKHGPDRLRDLIEGAANSIEYRLLREREKFDVTSPDGKVSFLTAAVGVLAQVDSAIERDVYAGKLASELEVSKEAILSQMQKAARTRRRTQEKTAMRAVQFTDNSPQNTANPERAKRLRAAKAEEILIATLMQSPDFLVKIEARLSPDDFLTDFNRRVFTVLCDLIHEGRVPELALLSARFTPAEMGAIAGIIAQDATISNTVAECGDCIKVLSEEKAKLETADPASASDDEFLALFQQKSNSLPARREQGQMEHT